MKNKNKENKAFTKKWFYIAVGFGVFFAIITTFIAICRNLSNSSETDSMLNKEFIETENNKTDVEKEYDFNLDDVENSSSDKENFKKNKIITSNDDEKFYDDAQEEDEEEEEEKVQETKVKKTSATTQDIQKKEKFSKPVEGTIIQEDSNNKPVYWKTLAYWRTHDGIDIAAKKNTPVKSVADGIVEDIETNDKTWGVCVTINHQNGFKSVYKGLSDQLQVKLNQKVQEQDIIGSIGEAVKMENNLGEHLHFMLQKKDEWVNPKEYINYN